MDRCQCCGEMADNCRMYGEADSDGHVWQYVVCQDCYDSCKESDSEGRPVHNIES